MGGGSDDVKAVALEAIGNMAFCTDNRAILYAAHGIKQRTARLALAAEGTVKHTVKAAAIRALAILGMLLLLLLMMMMMLLMMVMVLLLLMMVLLMMMVMCCPLCLLLFKH